MSKHTHTPGPWWVRYKKDGAGNVISCFVAAKDVNGFAYDSDILGEDEYREENNKGEPMPGVERLIADCNLVSAAPDLLAALENGVGFIEDYAGDCVQQDRPDQAHAAYALAEVARAAIAKAKGEFK